MRQCPHWWSCCYCYYCCYKHSSILICRLICNIWTSNIIFKLKSLLKLQSLKWYKREKSNYNIIKGLDTTTVVIITTTRHILHSHFFYIIFMDFSKIKINLFYVLHEVLGFCNNIPFSFASKEASFQEAFQT